MENKKREEEEEEEEGDLASVKSGFQRLIQVFTATSSRDISTGLR